LPSYKLVIMSNPVPDREDDYNDWYQNIHLGQLMTLPGFKSAQRFRRVRSLVEGDTHPYLAVYELETDDIDSVLDGLRTAAANKRLTMSDTLDTSNIHAVVYEKFGDEVVET
jgi:hypothetical protein